MTDDVRGRTPRDYVRSVAAVAAIAALLGLAVTAVVSGTQASLNRKSVSPSAPASPSSALPSQSATETPAPSPSPVPTLTPSPIRLSLAAWLQSLPTTKAVPLVPVPMWKHTTIEVSGVTYPVPDAGYLKLFAQLPGQRLLVRARYRDSDAGLANAWSSTGILAADGKFTTLFEDTAGSLELNSAYDSVHHVIAVGHVVVSTKAGSTRAPTYVVNFYDDTGRRLGKRIGVGALRLVGYVSTGLIVDPDIGADQNREELWPSIKAPAQDLGNLKTIVALGGAPQDRLIILNGNCVILDLKAQTSSTVNCDADETLSPTSAWYLAGNGVVYSTSDKTFALSLLPQGERATVEWQDDNTVLLKDLLPKTNNLWQVLCDVPSGKCARTIDETGPPTSSKDVLLQP